MQQFNHPCCTSLGHLGGILVHKVDVSALPLRHDEPIRDNSHTFAIISS